MNTCTGKKNIRNFDFPRSVSFWLHARQFPNNVVESVRFGNYSVPNMGRRGENRSLRQNWGQKNYCCNYYILRRLLLGGAMYTWNDDMGTTGCLPSRNQRTNSLKFLYSFCCCWYVVRSEFSALRMPPSAQKTKYGTNNCRYIDWGIRCYADGATYGCLSCRDNDENLLYVHLSGTIVTW